ncbi:MAG TPA: AsmA family protein [Burkholderiales bacterium]|nr:AsmA family protein [Burkholderiales bacterium]
MKVFKYLLYALGGLILLLVAIVAIVAATFDPNDYKPQIVRYVKTHYDRNLAIGDVGLQWFPKIGVRLTKVSLSERSGTGEFAGVDEAQVSLALLPLLSRNVVVDSVHADGLRAHLVKHADGTTNYDDLLKPSAPPSEAPAPTEPRKPIRLDIDGIRVTRSQLTWKDEAARQDLALSLANFETQRLVENQPSRVNVDVRVQGQQPKIDAHLVLTGTLVFDLTQQQVNFTGLDASVQGNAAELTHLALTMKGDLAANGAQKRVSLSRLSVDGKATRGNDRFDVKLNAPLLESSPQMLRAENLALNLTGQIAGVRVDASSLKAPQLDANFEQGQLRVQGFTLTAKGQRGADDVDINLSVPRIDVSGERASGNSAMLHAKLAGAAQAADVTLRLTGVDGSARAVRVAAVTLDLDARQQDTTIKGRLATPLNGNLQAKVFELPKLDGAFTVSDPAFPRKSFQVPVSGSARADLGKQNAAIDLKTRFDESNITAAARVIGFGPTAYTFDVAVDKLNIDQYRKAGAPATKPSKPAEGETKAEAPIDLSALKTLNVDGKLKVGQLQANNIKVGNLRVDLHAKNGHLQVDPLIASLYEGNTRGSISVDANTNRFALKQSMSGVEIGPLLRDAVQKDVLEGKGSVMLDLRSQGNTVTGLKRALDGQAGIALRDGAIKGVDLASAVRRVKATLSGSDAEGTASSQERTDFSELTATFTIRNGVAHNDDLNLKSPLLRIGGQGDIDLVAGRIDYTVKTAVVGTLAGQGGKEFGELRGITVPVRVSGPFDQLHYKVEFSRMVREATKEQLQAAKEAGKAALKDAARTKLQELLGGKAAPPPSSGGTGSANQSEAAPRKEKPEEQLKQRLKDLLR